MKTAAAGLLALGALAGLVGCGSSSSATSSDPATSTTASYSGATANPPKPAPALALKNSLGQPVNIKNYRGKAVLVTFIYDHCPDICPTIVSNLRLAQNELGPQAKDMQVIAVSVDPKGDTPKTVNKFLKDRLMTGRMQYLIGSRPQLERVWVNWNITSRDDPSRKDPEAVEHS